MKKHYNVYAYVDEVASCMSTTEEEYDLLKAELTRDIFKRNKFSFHPEVKPHDFVSGDLYIIDFGGLASYGSSVDYLTRELLRKIEDMPNTAFMIWSSFTVSYFTNIACDCAGIDCLSDWRKSFNVFMYKPPASWVTFDEEEKYRKKTIKQLRQFLGLIK